jgi:hypothetical protein
VAAVDWTNFGSAISAATVKITGLTASSDYNFKVTAINDTGSTDSNIEAKTTGASMDLVTAMAARMAVDIEAMSTANGYRSTWGTCNIKDAAKKTTHPNAEIYFAKEENLDERSSGVANAFTNELPCEIHVFCELSTIGDNPEFEMNAEYNKALEDLKRCFTEDNSLNGLCHSVVYRGCDREKTPNGDTVIFGKLITRWGIVYAQDRATPSLAAN